MPKVTRERIDQIDALVAQYQDNEDSSALGQLLAYFEPLILKFLNILHPSRKVHPTSPEVRAFTKLFKRYNTLNSVAKVRRLFIIFTEDELHSDLVLVFAELVSSYKVTYKKEDGVRINFLRYMQAKFAYKLRDLVVHLDRDAQAHAVSLNQTVKREGDSGYGDLSMMDLLVDTKVPHPLDPAIKDIDIDWVSSPGSDSVFSTLTHTERYIIYLKHEEKLTWPQIKDSLGISIKFARRRYKDAKLKITEQINYNKNN